MSERTIDDEISEFGVATVGTIDSHKLEVGFLEVKKRYLRQTELKWNTECDAVVSDFETRLKPNITILRAKTCHNRRFVFFHEYPVASSAYRPEHGTGKYTVAIVIRDGPGLPHFCKGSHKSNELDLSTPSRISAGQGSVIVFDATIGREDPLVKGVGWAGILLLYRDGDART